MSRKRKLLWPLLLVLGGALAAGYWFVAIPASPVPNGPVSTMRLAAGPYRVLSESHELVDDSRGSRAYGDFAGLPSRTLDVQLWRPERAQRPGPLVIYSHGFMSFRREGLYLARFLASHGYTVAAADYPLTGMKAPDGPLMADVVNQPGDIRFIIDTLLQRNADPDDPLHGTIDPERIAVAGVSLGGMTSLLTAFHRDLRDPRVRAAISIGGPTTVFNGKFYSTGELPLLLIYGSDDAIVDYEANALPVIAYYPRAILVTLEGASHAGFAQPASTVMRFVQNPDELGCRAVTEALDIEAARRDEDFIRGLGGADAGIDLEGEIAFCDQPLVPETMEAARQHMFTILAAHAFLESVFAEDAAARRDARTYLQRTLARENPAEVRVTGPAAAAG